LGHNFKKAGDINKASEGLKEEFKILMSHDPSHWEYEIKITKNFHPFWSCMVCNLELKSQVILSGAWLSMFMHNGLVCMKI
jgi:hypothetical protein